MLLRRACRARTSKDVPFLLKRLVGPDPAPLHLASTLARPVCYLSSISSHISLELSSLLTLLAEPRGRFGGDRYGDDRRRGGYGGGGGYGRRDDYRYRGPDRYDDRRGGGYGGEDRSYGRDYDRGYRGGGSSGGGGSGEGRDYDRGNYREERGGYERRPRDDYEGGRVDRYAGGGREDRYGAPRGGGAGGGSGGGSGGFDRYDRGGDRAPRDAAPPAGGYSDAGSRSEARDSYGGMIILAPSSPFPKRRD